MQKPRKTDWDAVVQRAMAADGEWVEVFRDVPVIATRSVINAGREKAFDQLGDGELRTRFVDPHMGVDGVKRGDLYVRYAEDPTDPEDPKWLPRRMGRPTGSKAKGKKTSSTTAITVPGELGDAVEAAAKAAGVPRTAIVNAAVEKYITDGTDYQLPRKKPRRRRVGLNATVPPETWSTAVERAEQDGFPLRTILSHEIRKSLGLGPAEE